jgi:hypothetical protein
MHHGFPTTTTCNGSKRCDNWKDKIMEALYLVKNDREYKVVSYDQETQTIELQGKRGSFKEKFDKELFRRMGYELIRKKEPEMAE